MISDEKRRWGGRIGFDMFGKEGLRRSFQGAGGCYYVELPGLLAPDLPNAASGCGISEKPLWVSGIMDCCAVALVGEHFSAATHHNIQRGTGVPEYYLPEALDNLRGIGETSVYAAVVGGDEEHFDRILHVLRSQRIPVVGRLRDPGRDGHWHPKSMKVLTATREVIVEVRLNFWEHVYKRLAPWTLTSNIDFLMA